jgi:hypothetical protein
MISITRQQDYWYTQAAQWIFFSRKRSLSSNRNHVFNVLNREAHRNAYDSLGLLTRICNRLAWEGLLVQVTIVERYTAIIRKTVG